MKDKDYLAWTVLAVGMAGPVVVAAANPLLAYRNVQYIVGGFAGIVCLSLFLVQPLLAAGYLPGLDPATARKWHRRVGTLILVCVAAHVGGLYLTSAEDTLDALLLVAPTPFSVWGVVAMWAVVATAGIVALRNRISYGFYSVFHNIVALVVVLATVLHAVQIEGAMGAVSKWLLCLAVVVATLVALAHLRVLRPLKRRKAA